MGSKRKGDSILRGTINIRSSETKVGEVEDLPAWHAIRVERAARHGREMQVSLCLHLTQILFSRTAFSIRVYH